MNLQEDLLMAVKQNLQLLGLDDDQALIFLTLYNNGSLSVVQLSRKTGFGRNKVYRLLKELMELNLINQMVRPSGSKYEVLDFKSLEEIVNKRKEEYLNAKKGLDGLLAELPYLKDAKYMSSKVINYRGIEGLKQVNWNLVHAKGLYRVYEVSRLSDYLDKKFAEKLRLEWLRRKIYSRDLTNDKEISDWSQVVEFTTKYSEYRYISPDILKINTEVYIYNDVVTILQYDNLKFDPNSIFCVEIYNQALADFQKQIYDIIWAQAKPMKLVSQFGARKVL